MTQIIATPRVFAINLVTNLHYPVAAGLEDNVRVPEADETDANFLEVSVWDWKGVAVDQGDEVAEWAGEIIGRPVRLVRASEEYPRYVEGNRKLGRVAFADGYPLLVTSMPSIKAVNSELANTGKSPVDSATFRPNLVLDGPEMEPFDEDKITEIEIEVEETGLIWKFLRAKPCGRCVMVDRDPESGDTRPGVQKALATLARKGTYTEERFGSKEQAFFGQNFVIQVPEGARYDEGLFLKRDMEVRVKFSDSANWA